MSNVRWFERVLMPDPPELNASSTFTDAAGETDSWLFQASRYST